MIDERVARACAGWWADRLGQPNKRDEFRAALQKRIVEEYDDKYGIKLEVDYDPFGPLLTALHDVGIECRGCMFSACGLFPSKTRMYVRPERVETIEGYGAPLRLLLGTPRPPEEP